MGAEAAVSMMVLPVHVGGNRAHPMLTYRVPGDTGTNQPSGSDRRISRSMLTPAPTSTTPVIGSMSPMAPKADVSMTMPPRTVPRRRSCVQDPWRSSPASSRNSGGQTENHPGVEGTG